MALGHRVVGAPQVMLDASGRKGGTTEWPSKDSGSGVVASPIQTGAIQTI